jgi:hypothetical protein
MAPGTRNPPPKAKPAAEAVPATDVPFLVWKAEAVLALVMVHQQALTATHDSFWTQVYIRGLSPQQAAEMAAREYDATYPPTERTRRTIR